MKRYATTANLFYTEWGASSTAANVIIEDDKPRQTGLVDQFGVTICAYDEKPQVGFIPRGERPKG